MKSIKVISAVVWSLFMGSNLCYCQNYFEEASKEYFTGDLNKSVELFTKSIENRQEVAKSYMYRGAAESFLKMFPQSLADLDSSYKLDAGYYKIYYYYGKYYVFIGSYDRAIQYYSTAIAKHPDYPAAYDERAVARGMLKDFKGCIEDEDKAIQLDPSKQIYYTDRGFAKSELKRYEDAISDYNISLKLEPNHKAYADRGYAFSHLGQHQKAIDDYTIALTIFPGDYELYYRRGVSYKAIGKTNEACADFAKSSELGYAPAIAEQKNSCKQ